MISDVFHQHFESDEVIHFWEKIKKIIALQDQFHLDLFEDCKIASEFSSKLNSCSEIIDHIYSYIKHVNFNHSIVLFTLLIELCEQRPISKRIYEKVKYYLTGRRSFKDFTKYHNFLINLIIEIVFEEIEIITDEIPSKNDYLDLVSQIFSYLTKSICSTAETNV
jgi:hypothetical protein